jgi:hypothetical protein
MDRDFRDVNRCATELCDHVNRRIEGRDDNG